MLDDWVRILRHFNLSEFGDFLNIELRSSKHWAIQDIDSFCNNFNIRVAWSRLLLSKLFLDEVIHCFEGIWIRNGWLDLPRHTVFRLLRLWNNLLLFKLLLLLFSLFLRRLRLSLRLSLRSNFLLGRFLLDCLTLLRNFLQLRLFLRCNLIFLSKSNGRPTTRMVI